MKTTSCATSALLLSAILADFTQLLSTAACVPGRAGFSNSCANNDPSKGFENCTFQSSYAPCTAALSFRIFAACSGAI